ncbi:MAG: hypothetical protein LBV17_07785 [Treponema sp.]|jgi:hypothetical protein|nr:hypothetical protein [Treponema sp.]
MKNEINKDFYCSQFTGDIGCIETLNKFRECPNCECYHRKHPTPEQFKEEYGKDVPDDSAVYYISNADNPYYKASDFKFAKEFCDGRMDAPIICACTPFGKPDDDWRPK